MMLRCSQKNRLRRRTLPFIPLNQPFIFGTNNDDHKLQRRFVENHLSKDQHVSVFKMKISKTTQEWLHLIKWSKNIILSVLNYNHFKILLSIVISRLKSKYWAMYFTNQTRIIIFGSVVIVLSLTQTHCRNRILDFRNIFDLL